MRRWVDRGDVGGQMRTKRWVDKGDVRRWVNRGDTRRDGWMKVV